jgi:ABC-2 type transport system ATP-binding protein
MTLSTGRGMGDAGAVNLALGSFDPGLLLLLVPVIVIQLALLVLAVVDLLRDDRRVRGGNKGVWAVIIVFVNVLGPILYFLVGRDEGPPPEREPGPGAVPGWGSPHDPPIVVGPAAGRAAPGGPADVAVTPPGAAGTSPAVAPSPPGAVPRELAGVQPDAAPPRKDEPRPRPAIRPGAPSAIRVERLTKRYPGGVLALDGLDLDVPAGSVFGLLGPNGAGKTTCLRLLAGLTRPTGGRALVAGTVVADDGLAVRRQLGYLEQDPRAYGWMTGREQLRFLGRAHGLAGESLERAVDEALARVDLAPAADRRTGTYSGGMRQRLGIAGALLHRPPILILDEPVSALDPEGRRDMLELVSSLRGEATVLFSSHVLADVERICDRVGILDHGRLVVEGPLDDLLDRFALPVYRVEVEPGQADGLSDLAGRLRDLPWVTAASIEHGLLTVAVADPGVAARELLPIVGAAGLAVISVARARPTLEDVFLRLTAGEGAAA